MTNGVEMVNKVFGYVSVISPSRTVNGTRRYDCKCLLCGQLFETSGKNLRSGRTRSCGCLRHHNTHYQTREYKIWGGIKYRCYNPNDTGYKYYGARGITVCARWLDPKHGYENFLTDMGPCPSKNHSVDRIDNDGDYSPENCRWVTHKEQCRNMRSNRWIEYGGIRLCLTDWCSALSIPMSSFAHKLDQGKNVGEIDSEYNSVLPSLLETPGDWYEDVEMP